jgi:hypothetical protein
MRHHWLLVMSDAERRRGMKGTETSTKSREWARSKSQRGFFIRNQIVDPLLEDERVDSKLVYVALSLLFFIR